MSKYHDKYKIESLIKNNCNENEELLMYLNVVPSFCEQDNYTFGIVTVDSEVSVKLFKYNTYDLDRYIRKLEKEDKRFSKLDKIGKNFSNSGKTLIEILEDKEHKKYMEVVKELFDDVVTSSKFYNYFFSSFYKGKIEFKDKKRLIKYIDLVYDLDYVNDRPDLLGFDGNSLNLCIPAKKVYFDMWSYCNKIYYEPVVELLNYLLESVSADREYLFRAMK